MHMLGIVEERRQGMESPRFRLAGCETGRECAHSNPNNTVMRDFWDGQFKRFGDWSKGHGWSIGNTIMNARTGYTDFRGIHDMKNIAAVDTRRTCGTP